MDFGLFGIGFPQIALIILVALIVFGPEKLPGMARTAGKWVNQMRQLTTEARTELQSLTQEIDLRNELNSVKQDLLDMRQEITDTGKALSADLTDLKDDITQEVKKELTLTDENGNSYKSAVEQYNYSVTSLESNADPVVDAATTTEALDEVGSLPAAVSNTLDAEAQAVANGEPISEEYTSFMSNLQITKEDNFAVNTNADDSFGSALPSDDLLATALSEDERLRQNLIQETVELSTSGEAVPNGNGSNGNYPDSWTAVTNGYYNEDRQQELETVRDANRPATREEMQSLELKLLESRRDMLERFEALEARLLDKLALLEAALPDNNQSNNEKVMVSALPEHSNSVVSE